MRTVWLVIKDGLARFWSGLRQWCGDAAYENYKECSKRTGQAKLQSPAEFYVEQLNKKYSRPNRCC